MQGRVKGTEVGTEDFGTLQHVVKILPCQIAHLAPVAHAFVTPDNLVVTVQEHDAIRHAFQNALVLDKAAELSKVGEVRGTDVHTVEMVVSKFGERP